MKFLTKNRSLLIGGALFIYFFLLLLGVLIPDLRLGTSGGFGTAFIYRAVIFTIFFIVIIFAFYKQRHPVNYVLAISLLIFFISNIIAIFVPHGGAEISLQYRWMAVLYLTSIIFTIFAFYEVLNLYIDKKALIVLFFLTILVALVCALYSDIAEFNDIIKAFTAEGEESHFYQIHSFFDNKNSYGLVLFIAMLANIYLLLFIKNKWLIIPLIFLAINLIISRSKTAIIVSLLMGLIIAIYYFVKSFTKHRVRNIVIVSSIGVLFVIFILVINVEAIYSSNSFFTHLANYVKEAFIGQAIRSLEDRFKNLSLASEIFFTPRIILGYGEHTCYTYANSCCYRLGYIDNAYIYNLLAGGIFKTLLFIYCYYLIFKNLIKLYKSNTLGIYKLLSYSSVIGILLYGLMENYQILGSNHVSFIFLMYSYVLPYLFIKEQVLKSE